MEYIYAAMLLHKAGKEVNEENVSQVLTAAGINADAARVKALIASLGDINIDEAIKSAPAITATATPVAAPTTEEAKPAEEEKKKEEEALEGLGALFG